MNKTQVIKILGKGTLVVTTLLFGVVSFWPIVNSTNHTGYEPYYLIIPFIILAIISFAMLIFTEAKNINAITILLSFVAILLLFTYKQFNIMLNYDEWLTRGMPSRFETVTTMFWAGTDKNSSQDNLYYISDPLNVENTYTNSDIQINYPDDWTYSINVYAGNDLTHVVFCPKSNFDEDTQECKLEDPTDIYPSGKYVEPIIALNQIYDYQDIPAVVDGENNHYLGSDTHGEYYISYRASEDNFKNIKLIAFDMMKTFKVQSQSSNSNSENGVKIYTWEIPVKINFPEGEDIEKIITEEYDESYVDYCHSAYDFIEKALQRNDTDFEFSHESGTFSEIAGLVSEGNNEWSLYLNGQKSSYKINEHCIEEDWDIELVYE